MRRILDEMRNCGDLALAELLELTPEQDRPETVLKLLVTLKDKSDAPDQVVGMYYLYYDALLEELQLSASVRLEKIMEFHSEQLGIVRYDRDVSLRRQVIGSIVRIWSKSLHERDVSKAIRWLMDFHILADQRFEVRKEYVNHLEQVVRGIPSEDIDFKTIMFSLKTIIEYKWAARESLQSFVLLLMQIRDRKMIREYSWPRGPRLVELLETEHEFILSNERKVE